jgi:hypothetical protein
MDDLLSRFRDTPEKEDDSENAAENAPEELEELPPEPAPPGEAQDDLLDTVKSSLGGIEKLTSKIPGYKGYKEKEMRREADKLLRTQLAGKFDDQRKRIAGLQQQLISMAKIEYLDDLERAVMKLQLLIDRIRTASYGYAGMFDAVKVKEEQLDALYEFDNRMLDFVDEVAADADRVTSAVAAGEGIGEAIGTLVTTADEANQAFGHREEVILQAGLE